MGPLLHDALPDDAEFDLDVRLEAVARHVSDEQETKPGPETPITGGETCPPSHCASCNC